MISINLALFSMKSQAQNPTNHFWCVHLLSSFSINCTNPFFFFLSFYAIESHFHSPYKSQLKSSFDQIRFIFQHSPPPSNLHTSSIGVAMLESQWSKIVINNRYDLIILAFLPTIIYILKVLFSSYQHAFFLNYQNWHIFGYWL